MAGDDPSSDHVQSEAFLSRVDRLVKHPSHQSIFHRTRQPFTRLGEVVGRIRSELGPRHPTHCQAQGCGAPLTEGYHRRADGLTLCAPCFQAMVDVGNAGSEAR